MIRNVFFVAIVSGLFFGCTTKKENKPVTVITTTPGTINIDSVAPPVVTMITAANAPKVIKAAPPTLVPLSYPYGVGLPDITHYGIAEGLPNINIRSSATDQQGNIWFITGAGISKYDGNSFTNYNAENGPNSGSASDLFIDSKNNIWIINPEGLNIFDGRYFTSVLPAKNKPDEIAFGNIFEDNKGAIWLTTYGQGLYKYKDNVFTNYTTADGLADMFILTVIQDMNGDILISTDKGITRYDGKTFTPYNEIPVSTEGKIPELMYCDRNGGIWFDNGSGELGLYDGSQLKIYTEKDRDRDSSRHYGLIGGFLQDRNGNYWIGGFNEVTKFDGSRFFKYPTNDGMSSFMIRTLTEDEYGNIWAGTQRNGIYKISNTYLSKIEAPAGVTNRKAIDQFGVMWVSGTKGIGKYNNGHIAYYGNELFFEFVGGFLIDHAGNKWFIATELATQKWRVVKFDGIEYTIFGKDQGIALGLIMDITEDNEKNIWFAGAKGVAKFNGSSFTSYGTAQGLTSTNITSVLHDTKDNIWFGSQEAGVFKYDGKHFTSFTTADGLPNNFINDITEDALGNIWLATDAGAARFDGHTFTSYRKIEGLSNVIEEVKYDSVNQSIWFVTQIGLASVKMKQLNDEKVIFQHFNPLTGFDFSIPRKINIDREGIVWVLSGSILRFDYKSISNSKPIPLQIRHVRLDNKHISWNTLRIGAYPADTKDSLTAINEMALKFGKSFSGEDFRSMSAAFGKVSYDSVTGSDFIPANLVLPIKNNNITFEYGCVSASFARSVQYQYKLEGYDKNWSELSTKTEASFGNMSEGNYTFLVRALSPFGSWSETSYSFKVLPPWYRTWWAYLSYVLLSGMGIFTFIRWRTKALQKDKIMLEEKVAIRTSELNQSLENLKATQSQLIQSEKMASLGELTAGIAHEIQNPLNFVNNFSEVNKELLAELKDEIKKGNLEEVNAIADDVISNEEKIIHHGKRADAIVKGMLQHSSSGSGKKEPTDINALADEYLRLAYHGFRAKDNSFIATLKTDFDPAIGNINIVPQDIGRVILNLISNAFYAVNEKAKLSVPEYIPTVEVGTKKTGNRIEVVVKDNGQGIPLKVLDKIFQPFFTTKPTGQGTGLGLSLSYDIVKAHGGDLKVETKDGEGSIFIIQLPTV